MGSFKFVFLVHDTEHRSSRLDRRTMDCQPVGNETSHLYLIREAINSNDRKETVFNPVFYIVIFSLNHLHGSKFEIQECGVPLRQESCVPCEMNFIQGFQNNN